MLCALGPLLHAPELLLLGLLLQKLCLFPQGLPLQGAPPQGLIPPGNLLPQPLGLRLCTLGFVPQVPLLLHTVDACVVCG